MLWLFQWPYYATVTNFHESGSWIHRHKLRLLSHFTADAASRSYSPSSCFDNQQFLGSNNPQSRQTSQEVCNGQNDTQNQNSECHQMDSMNAAENAENRTPLDIESFASKNINTTVLAIVEQRRWIRLNNHAHKLRYDLDSIVVSQTFELPRVKYRFLNVSHRLFSKRYMTRS